MKIKMLKTAAGPKGTKVAGRIYRDVETAEAKVLIAAKAAVSAETMSGEKKG